MQNIIEKHITLTIESRDFLGFIFKPRPLTYTASQEKRACYTIYSVKIGIHVLFKGLPYTGKSGSHNFHAISFSHENHALIMRKSDEKFLMQISCEYVRMIFA